MTVAVIQFPGSNCEDEALEALHTNEIPATIIDWNSTESLDAYNGFILPGGFSYQDRIRAGIIAAKLPIIQSLINQSELYKKPIMGICNGAQILVESGLVGSNSSSNTIIDINYVNQHSTNFLCDWAFLTPYNKSESIFLTNLPDQSILPIQVCHGEGRFIFDTPPITGLKYCNIDGEVSTNFPIIPNGSTHGIAAIGNPTGNVLAIMPHPERSLNQKRYPKSIQLIAEKNGYKLLNWDSLFQAFKVVS